MNRFVKFAAATLLVASATFAQEGALKVGAYVGAGLAGFNGDDADDIDAGLGFAVGGAMVMPLYPKIDITANVLFSMRNSTWSMGGGVTYTAQDLLDEMGLTQEQFDLTGQDMDELLAEYNDASGSSEADMSEMGIDVPVLVRYKIGQIFVLAGPQIGINLSSKTEDEDNDERATLEYGLTGGAGYLVSDKISIDARYYYGLSSVDDEGDMKVNPYYAMIGATYMF